MGAPSQKGSTRNKLWQATTMLSVANIVLPRPATIALPIRDWESRLRLSRGEKAAFETKEEQNTVKM
jgi:hypothetical protein